MAEIEHRFIVVAPLENAWSDFTDRRGAEGALATLDKFGTPAYLIEGYVSVLPARKRSEEGRP